jgi:hypothetical protein
MLAAKVLQGHWCRRCSHDASRLGLQTTQEVAHAKGGECLSRRYIDLRKPLRWRCAQGHEWNGALRDVMKAVQWCPACREQMTSEREKRTLGELQVFAAERGGRLLSEKYAGTRTRLRFCCAAGHEWEALPDNLLKKGHWCRACRMNWVSGNEQLECLRAIARTQGGELLSNEYVNCRTKVEVRCGHGHSWFATPSKLRQGRWCPVCHYDRLKTYRTKKRRAAKTGQSKAATPMLV